MSEGKSPGEGPERLPDCSYNKSEVGQRENSQKQQGNPDEIRKEQERINRDDARHQGGFPVAGHGEPKPENDPGRERSR
jgi:hypothetical protein